MNMGITSPYSLYSESLVTFDGGSGYNQGDATGFINLHSLSLRVCTQVRGNEDLKQKGYKFSFQGKEE